MLASVLMVGLATGPVVGDLPEGWRLPTSAELQNPMLPEAPTAFTRVVADFDDDGDDDLAILLKSTTSNTEALWVRLSDPDRPRWLLVNEISWGREYASVDLGMRIDKAKPGTYACPEAEAVCQRGRQGSTSTLVLTLPGIEYFRLGSASSLYFWDKEQGLFQQVRQSD